jgi:hypothetical protein
VAGSLMMSASLNIFSVLPHNSFRKASKFLLLRYAGTVQLLDQDLEPRRFRPLCKTHFQFLPHLWFRVCGRKAGVDRLLCKIVPEFLQCRNIGKLGGAFFSVRDERPHDTLPGTRNGREEDHLNENKANGSDKTQAGLRFCYLYLLADGLSEGRHRLKYMKDA